MTELPLIINITLALLVALFGEALVMRKRSDRCRAEADIYRWSQTFSATSLLITSSGFR